MQVVLTVSASDSSGCAGMQADIRAITANGAHAACVVTAATAQSSRRLVDVFPIAAKSIREQLQVVLTDLPVAAVKSGVLASVGAVDALAEALAGRGLPFVLDPVLAATSGGEFGGSDVTEAMRSLLFPLATILTPNADEAAMLSGVAVRDRGGAGRAARALRESGATAVLVKGGHLPGDSCVDVLVEADAETEFESEHIANPNTRGTGCTLASTIAVHLAAGMAVRDAVARAHAFVAGAIRGGYDIGGRGPADAFAFMRGPARESAVTPTLSLAGRRGKAHQSPAATEAAR